MGGKAGAVPAAAWRALVAGKPHVECISGAFLSCPRKCSQVTHSRVRDLLYFRVQRYQSTVTSPGWALYFCYVRMCCSSVDMLTYEVSLISINSNDNLDKSEFLLLYPDVCTEDRYFGLTIQ